MSRVEPLDFNNLDPQYSGFIEDYLRRFKLTGEKMRIPIPPADEMVFKAILPNYEFDVNIVGFKFIEATIRHFQAAEQVVNQSFGGFDRVSSFFDFASGYGRLSRALVQRMNAENIWSSDIYSDAIKWQRENIGINVVQSTLSPDLFEHQNIHDVIFVGSFFSHLPDNLFANWLDRLSLNLHPEGVLAFSVHDVSLLPDGVERSPLGLNYLRFSESDTLDADIYGMSYVTEDYVSKQIERNPRFGAYRRFPKGLYENQDLYVVGGAQKNLSDLFVASPPMGGLESISLLPTGQAQFSGWAIERTPNHRIDAIRVFANDVLVAEGRPEFERVDVLTYFPNAANLPVGWAIRLNTDALPEDSLLRFEIVSTTALIGLVYATAPRLAAFTYSGWSRRALRK